MFSNLKEKLLITRAEGALALAEINLERGQSAEAMRGFLVQARDLKRRSVAPGLQRRGWFGAMRAFARLLRTPGPGPDPNVLAEVLASVLPCQQHELPHDWRRYEDFRPMVLGLLDQGHDHLEVTAHLTWVLCDWFHADPRPYYARGRALELQLAQERALPARRRLAGDARAAYQRALGAASEAGARKRWEPILRLRQARLLAFELVRDDPGALDEALELLSIFEKGELRRLERPHRLTVAAVWLRSPRAMIRVRALDALDDLLTQDPALGPAVMRALETYLEGLDWSFYSTEQDRIRAIIRTHDSPRARRMLAYLDLLHVLHGERGRHSLADRAHLERLLEAERGSKGQGKDSAGARFYSVALALTQDTSPSLQEVLHEHGLQEQVLPPLDLNLPLAMALESLRLRIHPDRDAARRLLSAFARPIHQVPHTQAAFALFVPVLLKHWREWAALQVEMRRGISSFIQLAPAPSVGFATIGVALVGLEEFELARKAARRAQSADGEDPQALRLLRLALARHDLHLGGTEEAVGWLLPIWSS